MTTYVLLLSLFTTVLTRRSPQSSEAGSKWWADAITEHVLGKGLTGMWSVLTLFQFALVSDCYCPSRIDNNEMAGLVGEKPAHIPHVPNLL